MYTWVRIAAYAVVIVVSYVIGSLNFSIIVSRLYAGDDVRKHGSGNAGMTNTLRTYGIKPAVYTALGDFLKSVVAVLLARYLIFPRLFGFHAAGGPLQVDIGYIAAFFVLVGHAYPIFFGFKGGKGVMTALGAILVLDPILLPLLLLVAMPFIIKTRYISLGSILGAALFPVFTFIKRLIEGRNPWMDSLCALAIGGFVLILHRGNIKRLLTGQEKQFTPPNKEDIKKVLEEKNKTEADDNE